MNTNDNNKIRLLYMDDEARDTELLCSYFSEYAPEFIITCVDRGEKCLKILKDESFNLILLDYNLPDYTGIQILQQIIKRKVSIPVVMITAQGDEKLVVQALKLGASDYVSKHGNYLNEVLKVLRRVHDDYNHQSSLKIAMSQDLLNVLFIEHDKMDIELTMNHFAREAPNISLHPAHSITIALNELRKRDFDLISADLRMPQSTGLDFIRESRFLGITTPIIIITGKGDEETAVMLLKLGAYDYVVKRDNYLEQLPYVMQNAILRHRQAKLNMELELQVQDRNAQLELAYKDLESFSYSVSHDLRAPLRAIDGFSAILQESCVSVLPDEGKVLVADIRSNTHKMDELIKHLLDLSRLGRQAIKMSVVDFNVMTDELIAEIKGEYPNHPVEFFREEFPEITCDKDLMHHVWMNILSNAVKFSKNSNQSEIRINFSKAENEIIISVSDNGVGIDPQFTEKLFGVFQRFHPQSEFEGSGIGLAIVHRILTKLNGKIWADSSPGKGAKFSFSLPILGS